MKRINKYKQAVQWIALNDEPEETDLETVANMISVLLVADVFAKFPKQVAVAVIKVRRDAQELRKASGE